MRPGGATIRHAAGRLLVFAAAIAGAWAAVTLISGGFTLHGGPLVLSSRDPVRPLLAAAALLAAARLLLSHAEFVSAATLVTGDRDRVAARIACAAAAGVLAFSIAWSSRVAGGSDSSCYLLQADALAHGRATLSNPAALVLPDAPGAVFAPIGFMPSRVRPAEAVPICGPGLALLMAGALRIHRDAVFLIVPAFAALLVWLTFVFGRRVDDEVTGACAAVLLACSPIVLYQAVQPMTDVPAAALWMAALTATARGDRRGVIGGGVCASLAVLMRLNLALLVIPLAFLLFRSAFRRNVLFLLAMAPGLLVLAALNVARYGAPLASGYGDTGTYFSIAHVAPNAARYSRWLLETHTAFLLLALGAPWAIARDEGKRRLALVSLGGVALVVATYLAFSVFDDWWYTRFLLPALPTLLALSVAVALAVVSGVWRSRAARVAVAAGLCVVLAPWYVHETRTHHALDLQSLESRFAIAGRYAARALPANAVVLSMQQSGSLRFHGGRATIAWDAIAPGGLDATLEALRAAGRAPFLALEEVEEGRFRARFGSERFGRLDWPPTAEVLGRVRVRFFTPEAREPYLRGEPYRTEYVR
jgi:hypothetical protein